METEDYMLKMISEKIIKKQSSTDAEMEHVKM